MYKLKNPFGVKGELIMEFKTYLILGDKET